MAAPVDVNRSYEKVEWHLLNLVNEMGSWRCHYLTHSQNRGGVRNSGTICEWLGGVGGGLVDMLMYPTV